MRPAALEEVCFQSASQQTDFAEISVQVHSGSLFTHRSLEGRPFRSLAQESVSVMAKHSSASRHLARFHRLGADPVVSQMTFKTNVAARYR